MKHAFICLKCTYPQYRQHTCIRYYRLSQARTWLLMPYDVFLFVFNDLRWDGDCLCCWYPWNWWPSLFKYSFRVTLGIKMTRKSASKCMCAKSKQIVMQSNCNWSVCSKQRQCSVMYTCVKGIDFCLCFLLNLELLRGCDTFFFILLNHNNYQ